MLHPRARTMLILSVPAILIGIACSLILIVAMKVAALLQRVLWSNLPAQLGVSADSPLWVIAMLTATGIAVGLVIRYSPGHAGPDPATESLIGAPIATGALPGLGRADPRPRRRRQPRPGASDYGGEYSRWLSLSAPDCFRASARWTGPSSRPQAPSAPSSVPRLPPR